ncbi:MAG: hypothetical protein KAG97_03410, partial [Victivallales bacterium]|nr:hypothetical protein [Victivallales bacterium]
LESGLESIFRKVLSALLKGDLAKSELAMAIGQKTASGKLHQRVREMLDGDFIEYTMPEKPNSRLQKYRLTEKGKALLANEQ